MRWKHCLWAAVAFYVACPFLDVERSWGQQPPPKTSELLGKGKKLYDQNCTPCHGAQGNGQGALAKILNPPPRNLTEPPKVWAKSKGDPSKIFEIIKKGVPDTAMPKFTLPDEDIWALVYTVMEFSKDGAAPKK